MEKARLAHRERAAGGCIGSNGPVSVRKKKGRVSLGARENSGGRKTKTKRRETKFAPSAKPSGAQRTRLKTERERTQGRPAVDVRSARQKNSPNSCSGDYGVARFECTISAIP